MFRNRFFVMLVLIGALFSQSASPISVDPLCDMAQYVSDPSVPDGASFSTGAAFTKTWRLMNAGTCTWTTSYTLIFVDGDPLGAPALVTMPVQVVPGQMVDISVNMTAPAAPGHYRGYWKLSNEAGATFGIGSAASDAFWVDINVVDINTVIYDFVANALYAQWKSAAGVLPYPGTSGDSRGYSFQLNNPRLEDDSVDTLPGLLMVPHNKYNGYIQATYPEFLVQTGDRFQSLVNCEFGATRCYVTFRLDYITSAGSVRTLWTWKEAYDHRFYRADVDLSRLAGQRVRLILNIQSTGSASGDRAVWGAPRIIRVGNVQPPAPAPTLTPLPALTPTSTPFSTPPPVSPSACERAAFVADITVPDGTPFSPGEAFTKTWRLKNSGSCAWTTSYNFVFYSGSQMGAPTVLNMPRIVVPGETVDLTLNMVAPPTAGAYRGNWILQNASGALFGLGKDASMPVWVQINVVGEAPVESGYDFVKNACAAEWKVAIGISPCPGLNGDLAGFVLPLNSTQLEDGTRGPAPSLLMAPQYKYNGYIQGFYPTFTVQPGDRFQTAVGCEYGTSCYVTFKLDYMTATGSISSFWSWREQNDGRYYNADVDLTPLAGRSVRFILTILATGSPAGDRALWAAPRIVRRGPPIIPTTVTPTYTATYTPTPVSVNWLTYLNTKYGFQFMYSPEGQITAQDDNHARITLPFVPGTNLREKYLDLVVAENPTACRSPLASPMSTSETVTINGLTFLKESGEEGALGSYYIWIAYSIAQGSTCVSLDFVLHAINPSNFETPPPVFDRAAESAIFQNIAATFSWLPPTPTPTPTATPARTPDSALAAVLAALNARDFNGLKSLMGESFVLALWQSQGTPYTPDVAIEELQTYLSSTPSLAGDPGKDLTTLLGGTNPYSIMRLDSTNSQALFVSGWGLDAKGEAILFVTRRSDGSLYWHSVLIAPAGFAANTSLKGPYAVAGVVPNDALNIRSDAGANHPILGWFPPDATDIMLTGSSKTVSGAEWVEVKMLDGGTGWVNFYYLIEYVPTSTFCADARVPQLIEQLKQSMTQSNGGQFASLIGPRHGAAINFWRDAPPIHYTTDEARSIFTDTRVLDWGTGPAAGPVPISGTFANIVQPDLVTVFNSNYQLGCDNPSYAAMFVNPWPHTNIHYYSVLKPPTPDIVFDWRVWLMGFEYVNGQPYLYGTVHYVWEP